MRLFEMARNHAETEGGQSQEILRDARFEIGS